MKCFTLLLLLCLLVINGAMAQGTTGEYAIEDAAQLNTDLEENAHTEYILTTSGGVYEFGGDLDIDHSCTIKAADGLAEKPVIKVTAGSQAIEHDGLNGEEITNLTLQGIKFVGQRDDMYFISIEVATNLSIIDCDIIDYYDYGNGSIKFASGGTSSLNMQDCYLHVTDISAGTMRRFITLYDVGTLDGGGYPLYGDFMIKNCTFNNVGDMPFYCRTTGSSNPENLKGKVSLGNLTIDHCTFYEVGSTVIRYDWAAEVGTVVIKNNIFAGLAEGSNIVATNHPCTLDNNYSGTLVLTSTTQATITNTVTTEPTFIDATNNSFGLTNNPTLLGNDAVVLGDPNWAPEPTTSISDNKINVDFRVYSNNRQIVVFDNEGKFEKVEIINISGSVIAQTNLNETNATINVPVAGIYLVKGKTRNGLVMTKKVVVQ